MAFEFEEEKPKPASAADFVVMLTMVAQILLGIYLGAAWVVGDSPQKEKALIVLLIYWLTGIILAWIASILIDANIKISGDKDKIFVKEDKAGFAFLLVTSWIFFLPWLGVSILHDSIVSRLIKKLDKKNETTVDDQNTQLDNFIDEQKKILKEME